MVTAPIFTILETRKCYLCWCKIPRNANSAWSHTTLLNNAQRNSTHILDEFNHTCVWSKTPHCGNTSNVLDFHCSARVGRKRRAHNCKRTMRCLVKGWEERGRKFSLRDTNGTRARGWRANCFREMSFILVGMPALSPGMIFDRNQSYGPSGDHHGST